MLTEQYVNLPHSHSGSPLDCLLSQLTVNSKQIYQDGDRIVPIVLELKEAFKKTFGQVSDDGESFPLPTFIVKYTNDLTDFCNQHCCQV